jgi:hypothetical protein
VLSASAAAPAWAAGGEGEDRDGGDEEEPEQQQVVALRAYRLTLAANAPRAVFERVATWRLAPAPARGSGREDPCVLDAAGGGGGGGRGGDGPFDVAVVLPAGAAHGPTAWQRRQQRRVAALASAPGGEQQGEDGGAPLCLLDFTSLRK